RTQWAAAAVNLAGLVCFTTGFLGALWISISEVVAGKQAGGVTVLIIVLAGRLLGERKPAGWVVRRALCSRRARVGRGLAPVPEGEQRRGAPGRDAGPDHRVDIQRRLLPICDRGPRRAQRCIADAEARHDGRRGRPQWCRKDYARKTTREDVPAQRRRDH